MEVKSNNITYQKIKKVTREQLHNYPELKIKKIIKTIILTRKLKNINDKFFWPNGLLSISMEWVHRKENDENDINNLKKYYDNWIKKGLIIKNSDYIINGYSLIYLYKYTNEEKYLKAIKKLENYVENHWKTKEGILPYRESNKTTILVDSLGMICPFLCRLGHFKKDNTFIDLAVLQLINFLKKGMDDNLLLPYHGYNTNTYLKLGIVGWGRGVGWLLIGLIDSLEYIPKNHVKYDFLKRHFYDIVMNVIKYQRDDGAFTWQITAKEGHIDTSSTSMICYAIKRGIILNILPQSLSLKTELALKFLYSETKNGFVLNSSAECEGIGRYPQVYGNYPWSQGPTTSFAAISIEN